MVGAQGEHRLRREALAVPADADARGGGPLHRLQGEGVLRVVKLDGLLVFRLREVFQCVGGEFPYGSFGESSRSGAVLRDRSFDRYIAHGFSGDEVLGDTLFFQCGKDLRGDLFNELFARHTSGPPSVKMVGSPVRAVGCPFSRMPIFSIHCSNSLMGCSPRVWRTARMSWYEFVW